MLGLDRSQRRIPSTLHRPSHLPLPTHQLITNPLVTLNNSQESTSPCNHPLHLITPPDTPQELTRARAIFLRSIHDNKLDSSRAAFLGARLALNVCFQLSGALFRTSSLELSSLRGQIAAGGCFFRFCVLQGSFFGCSGYAGSW